MTGRALLDHLHTRASQLAGDAVACRLVQRLLHAATVPYFEILTKWVSEGVLEDPYEEFMVVEDAGVSVEADRDGLAAFWSHRHAMRPRLLAPGPDDPEFEVPSFLHAHAQYVLAAGVPPLSGYLKFKFPGTLTQKSNLIIGVSHREIAGTRP